MKFQIRESVFMNLCVRDFRWTQSEFLNCGTNGDSIAILRIQHSIVEPSHQRAATNERRAEPHAFFFGKSDDFDTEREPPSLQTFQQRNSNGYTEDAIVCTGVGNSIEVRAEEQTRRI